MPSWEDTKRAAQSAFIMTGNGFEDMHKSIANAYQQILTTGQLNPNMGGMSQNQEIGINPEYTQAEKAYVAQEQQKELDIEPER
jgi:hypothetical protein